MKPCVVCGVVCRVIVCYRSSLSRVARCVVHDCFSSEHLARSKTHGKTRRASRDARPLETSTLRFCHRRRAGGGARRGARAAVAHLGDAVAVVERQKRPIIWQKKPITWVMLLR